MRHFPPLFAFLSESRGAAFFEGFFAGKLTDIDVVSDLEKQKPAICTHIFISDIRHRKRNDAATQQQCTGRQCIRQDFNITYATTEDVQWYDRARSPSFCAERKTHEHRPFLLFGPIELY